MDRFLSLKKVSKLSKSDRDFYKEALKNVEKRAGFFHVASELLEEANSTEDFTERAALVDKMVEILYSPKSVRSAILSKLEFIEQKFLNEN